MFNNSIINIENTIPTELFLAVGGNTDSALFNPEDAFVIKRIPENRSSLIKEKILWSQNTVYSPWTGPNSGSYIFNEDNNRIYLCLGNNQYFRKDLHGYNLSTVKPDFGPESGGKITLSDGYTWQLVCQIPEDQITFITDSYIPIPSFKQTKTYQTLQQQYEKDCNYGPTGFGSCCLYYKEAIKDPFDGSVKAAGSLVDYTVFSYCYECNDLANALNKEKYFILGVTAAGITTDHTSANPLCPASVEIKDLKEELNYDVNFITPNTSAYTQYQLLNANNTNKTGIMYATIDLANLAFEERLVNTANPVVTVADPSGSGASVKLVTTPVSYGKFEVIGIEVLSSGEGYRLPSFEVQDENTNLNDRIDLYLYPDRCFETPTAFLPSNMYTVLAEITQTELANTSFNKTFTKIALAKKITNITSNAKNVYAKGDTTLYSTQTIAKLQENNPESVPENYLNPPLPMVEELENGLLRNLSKNNYDVYVTALETVGDRILKDGIYVPGIKVASNDVNAALDEGDIIQFRNKEYTVVEVTKPTIDKYMEYFSKIPVSITIPDAGPINNKVYQYNIIVTNTQPTNT
jgi:hypothetical protein